MKTVKQIDHILIQTKNPIKIFELLSQTLGLPVVWEIKSFGPIFQSGGISLGNINIEILNYARILKILKIAPSKDGIIGIAFDPLGSVEDLMTSLNKAGISHGNPKEFKGKVDQKRQILFTNLSLKKILKNAQIFFCKYSFDAEARRNKFNEILKGQNGGLLGVESVKEIELTYSNDKTKREWAKLSQEQCDTNYVSFGNGPKIKLMKSNKDSIVSILVKVESLSRAKESLEGIKNVKINKQNEIIFEQEQYLGIKLCE